MTQIKDPLSLLGRPSDSPEIQDLLRQAGVKDPKLKKGEVRDWLDLNDMGLALVFTDEAFLTGEKELAIGEGALILTSITFHSGGDPAFSAFAGNLPLGVKFTQSQSDLAAKLGVPERSNPRRRQDRWMIEKVAFYAKYSEKLDRIQVFGIFVPEPQ